MTQTYYFLQYTMNTHTTKQNTRLNYYIIFISDKTSHHLHVDWQNDKNTFLSWQKHILSQVWGHLFPDTNHLILGLLLQWLYINIHCTELLTDCIVYKWQLKTWHGTVEFSPNKTITSREAPVPCALMNNVVSSLGPGFALY